MRRSSEPVSGYCRRRAAMASRSSARRRLARASTPRTSRRRGVVSPSASETTRSDGREGSGTLAARPCAMNATRSLAARGVRWKVSTHRSSRQRLTFMNPSAGRHVARRPTPRSSMTMWRPRIAGSSWSLSRAAIRPLSRGSAGHASGTVKVPRPYRAASRGGRRARSDVALTRRGRLRPRSAGTVGHVMTSVCSSPAASSSVASARATPRRAPPRTRSVRPRGQGRPVNDARSSTDSLGPAASLRTSSAE